VLVDGAVEASGTHEQLLAAGGRYAELFELQAAGYR
jgi:ATP-binding cassette, subfamily B, bacterial